jgi:hypothetical protein
MRSRISGYVPSLVSLMESLRYDPQLRPRISSVSADTEKSLNSTFRAPHRCMAALILSPAE